MDYNTIDVLYKTSPVFAALRKEWLPFAIGFLYYAFKRKPQFTLSHDVFREQLEAYLEYVREIVPTERYQAHDADYFIDHWSREDDLIRIRNRDDGYVVHLSPHAERLIGWFEDLQYRGVIGTESRLRTILSLLDEVVTRSTEDVKIRLEQLHEHRDQIDAEIERINRTGEIGGLSDLQIRERMENISSMASQLLRDFSAVEERFREMARDIQQSQLDPEKRRGEILGTILDAHEKLEVSDEGQSFRAFYEILTHPEQHEKFDVLLNAIFNTPRLQALVGENTLLRHLTEHLLEAGERVNQSNQRLAEHLRRVVDTRNLMESHRVQVLAQEIKHLTSQFIADEAGARLLASRQRFWTVEGDPIVDLPLERPLYSPPEQIDVTIRPRQAPFRFNPDTLNVLYDTFFVDENALRGNIARLLVGRSQITLAEVLSYYPIKQGISEVVAYILLAAKEPQHYIDLTEQDTIVVTPSDNAEPREYVIPRIIFSRESNSETHYE